MSNYNIQIVGSANLKQPIGAFSQMEAMVGKVNEQMRLLVMQSGKMNQAGAYGAMTKGVQANSKAFRDATAASGLFRAEQVRVNTAAEDYTKSLQKQKLSFLDIAKSQKVAKRAYQEQIALQNMVARQLPTTVGGKTIVDTARPEITALSKDLDTARLRMAWFNAQMKSGAASMINWGKNTQWAGRQLTVGLTIPIGAFAAASAKMAYDVEANMVRVQKVYNTTANQFSKDSTEQAAAQRELAQLRVDSFQMATNAAKAYGASMKDTLDVEASLAAAGFQGNNLLSSTTEVVKNATLGEIDYQTAMKATIAMQQTMGYSTKQTADMWAYMNSVENSTSLSMKDFATAIPVALGPIKTMGGDVKTLGTLLTGMIERGVQVGKASNAIKAAMQRLYRPSKSVADEWQKITNTDINQVVTRNKGNIMGILTDIEKVTQGLDRVSKNKALAALFGSYQVGNYIAMLDSIKGINEGLGQAYTAYKIANQSAVKWREVQQGELNQWRKSVAGQFKTTWATLQAQMVQIGEPFLAMGTKVLNVISNIITAFNNMPESAKRAIAIGAIMAAVAGPIIMLTGLVANLVGNVIRAGASFAGLFVKMDILDKNSAATKLITDLTTTSFDRQASAAEANTKMIQALTEALYEAEAAQRSVTNAAMGSARLPGVAPGGGIAGLPIPSTMSRLQGETKYRYVNGVGVFQPTAVPGKAGMVPTVPEGANQLGITTAEAAKNTEQTAQETEKINGGMKAAAVSGGVFAAAMAASFMSSNKTVDSVAQLTMMASVLAPAMLSLWSIVKVSQWSNAITAASGAVSGRLLGVANSAKVLTAQVWMAESGTARIATAAGGIGKMFTAALGPVGILIVALTAAAFAVKKIEDAANKAGDATKAMYNNAKPLSDIYGYNYMEQGQLNVKSPSQAGTKQVTDAERVRKVAVAYSGVIEKIKQAQTEQEKYNEAVRLGSQVISSGGTVKDARQAMTDALTAAQGQADAHKIMLKFDSNLKGAAYAASITGQASAVAFNEAMGQAMQKGFAENFSNTFIEHGNWIKDVPIVGGWASMLGFGDNTPFISKAAEQNLLSQAANLRTELQAELDAGGDSSKFLTTISQQLGSIDTEISNSTGDQQKKWEELRKQYILAQASAFGLSSVFAKLPDSVFQTIDAVGLLKKLMVTFPKGVTQGWLPQTDAKNMAAYILQTVNNADKLKGSMDGVSNSTGDAANKAREFAQNLQAAKSVDIASMMKDTMSGIETSISTATSNQFDSQMNAALNRVQAAGQARLDAFDRHSQALQNAQDARFKKREAEINKSYDNRVKSVQKEIDAEKKADETRQKIFDAEQARIDRLNQQANDNIDFNIALNQGNFDEAARIRNNSAASDAQFQLQKQLDAANAASQKQQDRQQKRIDLLNKEKSTALSNLQTVETKEKAALQRSLDRKKKALDAEVKANEDAAKKMWDDRKKYLDQALKDFTGYTATSSADLYKHIQAWNDKYKQFDLATGNMFNLTVDDITQYLRKQISDSRDKIMNDALWSTAGNKIATKMIKGAFGMNKDQFFNWLAGKGPGPSAGGGKHGGSPGGGHHPGNGPGTQVPGSPHRGGSQFYHGGGQIGGAGDGGRGGTPRNAPLRSNEIPLVAERGEFMVNKHANKLYGAAALDAVNAGKATILTGTDSHSRQDGQHLPNTGGASDSLGTTGIMASAFATIMKNVIKYNIEKQAAAATARDAASAAGILGAITGANAGKYGTSYLNSDQVRNANIIASVGKNMGMSARDIEIGFMTALQESTLRNLPGGDGDSAGLFQQRPSMGWGTYAQVTNPQYAAKKFFEALKGVAGRGNMSMTQAAQAVQRSAYPTAYAKWQDEAIALWSAMQSKGGGGTSAGFVSGPGGKHRPVNGGTITQGLHDQWTGYPAIDIGVPVGTPVYAVGDGVITRSYDIPGYEPRAPSGGNGYKSYGRVIYEAIPGVGEVLLAHLSQRNVRAGQHVKGGSVIGRSGDTGYSFGPHLHFGARGVSPYAFLKTGGTVKYDNTPAILHKNERVLTEPLTKELDKGISNFSKLSNTLLSAGYNLDQIAAMKDFKELVGSISPATISQQTNKAQQIDNNMSSSKIPTGKISSAPGQIRLGEYNFKHDSVPMSDVEKIMKTVDIFGTSETLHSHAKLARWLMQRHWGYFQSNGSDTGIAYNKGLLALQQHGSMALPNSTYSGNVKTTAIPYGQFSTRGGSRFWLMAAHPQVRGHSGIQNAQYAKIRGLYSDLEKTGVPVFIAGDLNQPNPIGRHVGPAGVSAAFSHGIDNVLFRNNMSKLLKQGDFRMHSDHPFIWSMFDILGNGGKNMPAFREGAFTLSTGLAQLHPRETVLSEPLSDKLRTGLDRLVANESHNNYNLNMVFHGDVNNREELARFVLGTIKKAEARKPQPRRS